MRFDPEDLARLGARWQCGVSGASVGDASGIRPRTGDDGSLAARSSPETPSADARGEPWTISEVNEMLDERRMGSAGPTGLAGSRAAMGHRLGGVGA